MDILKATSKLFYKYPKLRLILIGYGKYKRKLIKFIQKNNLNKKIYLIDNCQNPYPFIHKSNLFLFASNYEGFPNVLVEALMLNTPVISSNCKSGPEEILLNGKAGDLFQKKNYEQLNVMIENFIKNPKKLVKKMKVGKKQLWKFSPDRHVKIYAKILFMGNKFLEILIDLEINYNTGLQPHGPGLLPAGAPRQPRARRRQQPGVPDIREPARRLRQRGAEIQRDPGGIQKKYTKLHKYDTICC